MVKEMKPSSEGREHVACLLHCELEELGNYLEHVAIHI